jgi:hypothetical protein
MKTLLALLLFVAPVFAQDQSAAALAGAGCGPNETEFNVKTDRKAHPMGQPAPGKALVYIIEDQPGTCVLDCVTVRTGLDGNWIGATQGTSYFYFSVDPGEHRICSEWQSSLKVLAKQGSASTLTAEPGKVYFFQARLLEHEKRTWEVILVPMDPAEGQFMIASTAYSTSTPKKK